MTSSRRSVRNLLLRAAGDQSFAAIEPLLEPFRLSKGAVMAEAGAAFEWAIFPEDGIVSIVNRTAGGRQIEVGIVGVDGFVGLPLILGTESMPHRAFVQVEGAAHRIPAEAFIRLVEGDPGLRAILLRYVQAFMVQVAETALSNGSYTIEERLARWLLLVDDRLSSNEVPLTHEFLSIMLGVRRTGVTLAIHVLEGGGMIRARRGVITILDRSKLMRAASDGYGPAEAEYNRLIGSLSISDALAAC